MSGAPGPAEEIPISPEMIEVGATVLGEFVASGLGLTNSPIYVVERVYLAMESVRLARKTATSQGP